MKIDQPIWYISYFHVLDFIDKIYELKHQTENSKGTQVHHKKRVYHHSRQTLEIHPYYPPAEVMVLKLGEVSVSGKLEGAWVTF
jgi:hypothetical protein